MLKREAQVVKLVDTRDLKSLGLNIRAGSTPALGTNKQLLAAFVVSGPCKISLSPHTTVILHTSILQSITSISFRSIPFQSPYAQRTSPALATKSSIALAIARSNKF